MAVDIKCWLSGDVNFVPAAICPVDDVSRKERRRLEGLDCRRRTLGRVFWNLMVMIPVELPEQSVVEVPRVQALNSQLMVLHRRTSLRRCHFFH